MTEKAESMEHDLESTGTITDKEKELGSNCHAAFLRHKYDDALKLLKELASNRSNDPKIQHNIGVAEFYASKFRNVDKFERVLQKIRKIYQLDMTTADRLDDIAHCVLYFNQAVILYHHHKYQTAIDLMNKVFDFIEPLDMDFKRRIFFLFIELYLCICEPNKALNLINYADKMLFQLSDSKKSENKNDQNGILAFKPKLLQYRVRSYMMLKSTKACKREIKTLSNSGLGCQALYLKANMEYLRGNYKKAIRLLNNAPILDKTEGQQETGENQSVYYYNNLGCIHLYMGKPNVSCHYFKVAMTKNINEFKKISESTSGAHTMKNLSLPAVSGNMQAKLMYNMGIACLHTGQPQNAFEYLMKAVGVFKSNPRLWLRIAECCIRIHKMTNEVDFRKPDKEVKFVKKLAGCGIHRKAILTSNVAHTSESDSRSPPLGPNLQFAAICLKNALFFTRLTPPPSDNASAQKSEQVEEQEKASQAGGSGSDVPSQAIRALPVHSMNISEITSLRTSILTASAYVSLSLEDPVVALHYAEEIMKQSKSSSIHRYLAHMYAAEALVKLDRLSEGIEYLNSDNFGPDFTISSDSPGNGRNVDSNSEKSSSSAGTNKESDKNTNQILKGWFPNTTSIARNAMQYNLTAAHALRGELDKARSQLQKMIDFAVKSNTDIPVHVPVLAAYIQLLSGNADATRKFLTKHCPQYQ